MGSATSFFDLTEISNKRAKGWWNNNRKEMKESVRRYKLRQKLTKNGRSQGTIPNCHF